ncbi:NfeD family protein [Bacillus salitolerans]|uniref:NfeD family protein n=1 Tax=Bacillus salitolerans TaxID=1437434 RepID=A0ABW4LN82_9BACI
MEILQYPSIGFFVLLIGTLFIVGEMLVKTRGIFGLIGIGLVSIYFVFHISGENIVWITVLYIIGLFLVFIDGKFINDGTVAIIGLILMVTAVVIPAPSVVYGILSAFGLLIGASLAPLLLKVFPSRDMWNKMALKDRLTSEEGYNSINTSYQSLVGKQGVTVTPFRPVGTIDIEGKHYSAITDASWLEVGTTIEVIKVDGTKIAVKGIEK